MNTKLINTFIQEVTKEIDFVGDFEIDVAITYRNEVATGRVETTYPSAKDSLETILKECEAFETDGDIVTAIEWDYDEDSLN